MIDKSHIILILLIACCSTLASSQNHGRNLEFSPSSSTMAGTGIADFEAGTEVEVNVTSNLNIGGDTVFLKVSNKCSIQANSSCVVGAEVDNTIAAPIMLKMTDNSNGIYSVNYTVNGEGDISVMAMHLVQGSFTVNKYTNPESGPGLTPTNSLGSETWSNIDENWGTNVLFDDKSDGVSLTAFALIKAPFTGDVTFTLDSDDGSTLWFNGEEKIAKYSEAGTFSEQFTVALTKDEYYEIYIEYFENELDAFLNLYWEYDDQAKTVVPSTAFYSFEYINGSPYNITVSCPEGKSIDPNGDLYSCAIVCGDGLKAETETCDDSNTSGNDGCSADCASIEEGWACSGGSPTTADSCSQGSQETSEPSDSIEDETGSTSEPSDSTGEDSESTSNPNATRDPIGSIPDDSREPNDLDPKDSGEPNETGTDDPANTEACGDGIITQSEECDDGNNINNDGCSSQCAIEERFVCQSRDSRNTGCFECDPTYQPNASKDDCVREEEPEGVFEVSVVFAAIVGTGIAANIVLAAVAGQSAVSCLSVIYQIQILMLIPMSNYFTGNKVIFFFEYVRVILATYHFIPKYFIFWGWDSTFGKYEYESSHWYLQTLGFGSASALSNSGRIIFVFGSALFCFGMIGSLSVLALFTQNGSGFRRVTKSMFNFMLTRVFITLIFLSFVSLFISSTYEISGNNDTEGSSQSLASAYSIGGLCIGTFIISIVEWIRCMKPERFQSQYLLKGLYHGIKETNYARLYPCVWMLRRMAFVSVFVCLSNDGTLVKLSVVWTTQTLYLLYLICGPTLKSRKDKFIEIVNELVVLVISVNHQVKLPLFDTTYLTLIYFCNIITSLTALTIITAKIVVKLASSPITKKEIVRVYSMNKVKPMRTSQISGLPSQASNLDLASNYQESARDMIRGPKKELKNGRRVVDWNK